MKKEHLLFITAILVLFTANAQSSRNDFGSITSIKTDDFYNSVIDSVHLSYSNGRTGNFDSYYANEYGTDYDINSSYISTGSGYTPKKIEEKIYNSNNLITSYTISQWSIDHFEPEKRKMYSYDTFGRLISEASYIWANSNWVGIDSASYQLNSFGLQTLIETFLWYNNSWNVNDIITNTYNAYNQTLTTATFKDYIDNQLITSLKNYYYNNSNQLDSSVYQYGSPGILILGDKTIFVYDNTTNTTIQTEQAYNVNFWNDLSRLTTTTNNRGQVVSEIEEIYTSGNWRNKTKEISIYDGNGNLTDFTSYTYSFNAWQNNKYEQIYYNSVDDPIYHSWANWNGNNWEVSYYSNFTYPSQNPRMIDSSYSYNNGNVSKWYAKHYYFEKMTSDINDIPTLSSTVYPNPFTSNAAIQLTVTEAGNHTFEVYNLAGQRIHTESRQLAPGQQTIIWDGQEVPNGVYFYKVYSQNGLASGKLVKQ